MRLVLNGNLSTAANTYKIFLNSVDGIHTYPNLSGWGSALGEGMRLTDGHTYRLRIHEIGGTLESYGSYRFFPRWHKRADSAASSIIGDTSHTNSTGTDPEQYTDLLYDASLYDDDGVYVSIQLRHQTKIDGQDYAAIATNYELEVTIEDLGEAAVTVSSSAATIIAETNHRYVCNTLSSLSFTPCSSGLCEVIFTSGTSATVLDTSKLTNVMWPSWFNPSLLSASTTYDIMVMDGKYGAVMTWS
jgi:hypothetical protein